jgi:Spy/CpxP family protein refolding chaperone
MPRGDGTGPMGTGPRTGRGAGGCGGGNAAGFATSGAGLGFGRGRGGHRGQRGGHGRRNMYHATGLTGWQRAAMDAGTTPAANATPTENIERQTLETEIGAMQSHLDAMKKRLEELEAENV